VNGGVLETLSFAITGDARAPEIDDTAAYPTALVDKIWQDIEATSPRPAFALTVGNYVFASPTGDQAAAQLGIYLGASKAFSGPLYPAMGDMECTGSIDSNCGPGTADGVTNNYAAFLSMMMAPLGLAEPYYTVTIAGAGGAWTAKIVVVAANAWTPAQAAWLDAALATPTTYTFVLRNEGSTETTAPGVTPSADVMAQHPLTLLITGNAHTFEYLPAQREVIVGNGGAPLSGSVDYGYVIARQRADGAIVFEEDDYATNAVQTTFAVNADGTPAP
jgi:hypothetical protein